MLEVLDLILAQDKAQEVMNVGIFPPGIKTPLHEALPHEYLHTSVNRLVDKNQHVDTIADEWSNVMHAFCRTQETLLNRVGFRISDQ
jgi:hypothetical protein